MTTRRNLFTSTLAAIATLTVGKAQATEAGPVNPDDQYYCTGCGISCFDVAGMLYIDNHPWGRWLCPDCEATYDEPVDDDLTALYHEHFGTSADAESYIYEHGIVYRGYNTYPVVGGRLVNPMNQPMPEADSFVVAYQMQGETVLDNTDYVIEAKPLGEWINKAQFLEAVEQVRVYWF